MRYIINLTTMLILSCLLSSLAFAKGFSGQANDDELYRDNRQRTKQIVDHVEDYLRKNNTYVAIIARRGAGEPETGISDTDGLDLSGMAHCGFVVRNGFGKQAEFMTFNLVRQKGARHENGETYDMSELRVWSLPHFFVGTFEKDAIVFLPPKKVQLKLWNLLQANGRLKINPKKRFLEESITEAVIQKRRFVIDQIIANGAFPILHNPEYNLLSDYVESSTQNCNEHLLKTYIGFRDFYNPANDGYDIDHFSSEALVAMKAATKQSIKRHFTPRQMVLSRTKSTFAFTQNIRFGERYDTAPTFFGLKLQKERFDVVSVDSFCAPENQVFLKWQDFKVFRENYSATKGWFVEDWGRDYIKVNRFSEKKNTIEEL